jgi:pimeloyl-ACP methyl ester carboxylesterase
METSYKSVYKTEDDKRNLLEIYDKVLKNWPVPFSEAYKESKYGKTHILICGNENGKPVLVFHGTGNNSLMWRYNCEELGKKYCLYLVDTINDPGKSEYSNIFDPQKDYCNWIEDLINQLGLKSVSIIGHSKGGWLALNTVIGIPERIENVVLLAPAVGINSKLNMKFLLKSISVGINPSYGNIEKYFKYISCPGKLPNKQYIDYVSTLIKGTKSKPINHRQFNDTELRSIHKPLFLLFGEYEVCNNYKMVIERAKTLIHDLRFEVIHNAGHGLQGDCPEIVNELILDFLK